MTDEHEHAMKVWREACGESQEAFYRIGEQPNDPESIKQGQLADQAAAAVIAADRAGLVAEVERLREAWGYARPIIEQLAEWEQKNGSAVAIQVIEQPGLCTAVSRGCLLGGSPRAALSALSTTNPETSDAD